MAILVISFVKGIFINGVKLLDIEENGIASFLIVVEYF
jgi:hypothetical protein